MHNSNPKTLTLTQTNETRAQVVNIDEQYLVPGREKISGNGVHKQWLTRLEYLSRSPYEVSYHVLRWVG